MFRWSMPVVITLFAVFNPFAPAAAETSSAVRTLDAVIAEVLARHPDLEIARLDSAIAGTEIQRLDAGLDPQISARVSITDDRMPLMSEFQPAETLTGALTGTLTRPLESGGTLSATADYARTRQRFVSPFASQLALINPAYRGGVSVNYRHPLMRGDGRPEYHDALKAAGADHEAVRVQQLVIMRGLGLQALNGVFQLLADDIDIELAQTAVGRSERLLEYQGLREEFGLIESAERIQIEALVALRRLELQRAKARRQGSLAELNRLMLRDPGSPLQLAQFGSTRAPVVPSIEEGMRNARALRPEFLLIDRQIEAEEARLRLARDSQRPQLDLIAELGFFSFERNPVDATMLDHQDRFAGLSLEFSDVMGRRAARAEVLRGELGYRRLQSRIVQITEEVHDELALIHVSLATGAETLRLSRLHAESERRKFEAEVERFRDGRSDTATVIQFEGDLQAAELTERQQLLALRLADRQFAWVSGTLFEELGIDIGDRADR